jgi:hypothetical protein
VLVLAGETGLRDHMDPAQRITKHQQAGWALIPDSSPTSEELEKNSQYRNMGMFSIRCSFAR